jgi:uncharacterized protein YyaL (SSP411 family)
MPNRLINETSPYLLQHAHNPVNWYAWGAEALMKAQAEDKPIFLSIGYAACHWCHVMAHESFEDASIAARLNDNFVCIKVDREERPDLDAIYMSAVVALTGQGGWPLSAFLTPQGEPFFGGTYFPPSPRHGLPGFNELLENVIQAYQQHRTEIFTSAQKLTHHLQEQAQWKTAPTSALQPDLLKQSTNALIASYDRKFGGWGRAPKFPSAMTLEFLMRQAARGNAEAARVAVFSMRAMQRGGMYDVIGGGFHRYSTDERWLIPHFEKMLYDNALLSQVYLHAYQFNGDARLRQTAEETLDFILRELRNPQGGFYSSLDADSEGEEGTFYIWTRDELQNTLNPEDFALLNGCFSLPPAGNFEGKLVLQRPAEDDDLAAALALSADELRLRLHRVQIQLLAVRSRRTRPQTDDKVLTGWNGLALTAFAQAARALQRPDYLLAAQENAAFILNNLRSQGKLHRSWRSGQARNPAVLEDYAALIIGLLELYQSDFNNHWFQQAKMLVEEMVHLFGDESGGYFDAQTSSEGLLLRPKEVQDNATPCGNALAAQAELLLAALDGESNRSENALRMLSSLQDNLIRHPNAFAFWLQALDFFIGPVQQAALIWQPGDETWQTYVRQLYRGYHPNRIIAGAAYPPSKGVPALLNQRTTAEKPTAVYMCEGFACKLPAFTPEELEKQLQAAENPSSTG